MDISRCNVLLNFPRTLLQEKNTSNAIEDDEFSFETWQPLMASVRPYLADETQRLGILTDVKSELELVREVISLQEKPNN